MGIQNRIAFCLVFFFLLYGTIQAEESGWWDKNWEDRVALNIKDTAGIERINETVIIPGEIILSKSGAKDINANSIRVIGLKGELTSQVDEKDNTGDYVDNPNGVIDRDDEIVFQVNLAKNGNEKYFIYFSSNPMVKKVYSTDFETKTQSEVQQASMWTLLVNNLFLEVGFMGGNKKEEREWVNFPYSSKTFLYNGMSYLYSKENVSQLLGVPGLWFSLLSPTLWSWLPIEEYKGFYDIPWSSPKIVVKGPVRYIVRVSQEGTADLKWEKVKGYYDADLSNARITNQYTIYSISNLIDYTQIIDYGMPKQTVFKEFFFFKYNVGSFGPTLDDFYYIGENPPYEVSLKKLYTARYGEEDKSVGEGVIVEEAKIGWVAAVDKEQRSGLAIFGEKDKCQVRFSASFGEAYKLGTGHSGQEAGFIYSDKIDIKAKQKRARFGFYNFGDEAPEFISDRYKAWVVPVVTE